MQLRRGLQYCCDPGGSKVSVLHGASAQMRYAMWLFTST